MTGLFRTLGLVLCLSTPVLAAPALTRSARGPQDDLKTTFGQGVEMLQRGHHDEALAAFQKVLAMSPTEDQAYELWKSTDARAWTDLLVEGGQFELAAKRLLELARLRRKALANDEAAIKPLVVTAVTDGDAMARRKAILALSSNHGEYAVPYLLPYLGSENNDDERRVLAMHALSAMDTDVVPPLSEALANGTDVIQRRNVALVLGNIGDKRGGAVLLYAAKTDADESVKTAAAGSAKKIGAQGEAVPALLALGDAYHNGRTDVLGPRGVGEAVWKVADGKLVAEPVPQSLFNDEMALRAYKLALRADPTSVAALAGVARSYSSEKSQIDLLAAGGQDVGPWKARAESAQAIVLSAGVPALDTALVWSVKSADASAGSALATALGDVATSPTGGLQAALKSHDGAMASEAAVALGTIAVRTTTAASPETVQMLAQSVGREIQRVAAVVGEGEGVTSIADALEKHGVFVARYPTGAIASTMIRRSPGLDVIVIAETLKDLTTAQVLDEIKADDRTKAIPVVLVAKDPAAAAGVYGDKIAGATPGASDMGAIDTALGKELEGDRARASTIAARSAFVLAHLANKGRTDVSPAVGALAGAMSRPDPVATPAIQALAVVGGASEAPGLVAVLADDKRSEEVRAAAGSALAGILGRAPAALDQAALTQIASVAGSSAPITVRSAASRALGRAQMDPAVRADILSKLNG